MLFSPSVREGGWTPPSEIWQELNTEHRRRTMGLSHQCSMAWE